MKRLSMCAESIRAIQAHAKDLTSRVVVPQPSECGANWMWSYHHRSVHGNAAQIAEFMVQHAPYHVGERVALVEGFYVQADMGFKLCDPQPIHYAANVPDRRQVEDYRYLSARFMPVWAARYYAIITSVTAGRLWDMTYRDVVREGYPVPVDTRTLLTRDELLAKIKAADDWYMAWWDSLNAKRGYPSASNPWRRSYGLRVEER
jgi:hypothetical protein